jgi:murein DD-endopeptidase MepM/ murein hydrolase activator NlpD
MALSALASGLLSLGVAAVPVTASATPPAGGWRWPLPGTPVVARPFQRPPHPWAAGHRGVDLAAAPNTAVLAAGAGVVSFAGYVAGIGVVAVLHPGGLRTTYEPVAPQVSTGAVVALGQPLGRLLPGHGDCGPARWCLHWGLLRGATYLDPLTLVRRGPVRLLPLVGAPAALPVVRGAAAGVSAMTAVAAPPPADHRAAEHPPGDQPAAARSVTSAPTLRRPALVAAATTAGAAWLGRRRASRRVGRLSPAGRRAWP